MSTADARRGGVDFADEVMLKIWHWENGNWILNSRIDRPHGTDLFTSVTFSPRPLDDVEDYVLLTAGANGMLRSWQPSKTHDGDGTYPRIILNDCDVSADTMFRQFIGVVDPRLVTVINIRHKPFGPRMRH